MGTVTLPSSARRGERVDERTEGGIDVTRHRRDREVYVMGAQQLAALARLRGEEWLAPTWRARASPPSGPRA